jgi:L-threonylcarbamoyladenylate synthase
VPIATIEEAVGALARGELVGIPTETVYGLAADALQPEAVRAIFTRKGRPADHPLIVHVAPEARLEDWAAEVPEAARRLREAFWPGPLTMILRKSARVPTIVTGGQDTVGLRCPSHPLAQTLLREFARAGSGAVAAPSANRFGHVSPTSAQHVRDEFGDGLLVVDGGPCEVGLESTIVDLARGRVVLLRPGGISREAIASVLGRPPEAADETAPRASGTLAAHYAPNTALSLLSPREVDAQADPSVSVLARRPRPAGSRTRIWIDGGGDPVRYGHDLYANLRRLDASGASRILVEAPPVTPPWEAVNDRLARAAAGAGALPDET